MKEKLIELARYCEFSSDILTDKPWKYFVNENLRYLLWMTALQKWLREVHKIDAYPSLLLKGIDGDATGYFYVVFQDFKERNNWQDRYSEILEASEQDVTGNHVNQELYNKLLFDMKFAFHTYEEALEAALFEALNLIK